MFEASREFEFSPESRDEPFNFKLKTSTPRFAQSVACKQPGRTLRGSDG